MTLRLERSTLKTTRHCFAYSAILSVKPFGLALSIICAVFFARIGEARNPDSELNPVMMQAFHWSLSSDGNHWRTLAEKADHLARTGITALWLPPATKGLSGVFDVGYGTYDLFDLGEFFQKGSVRTKYGTKEDYLFAIQKSKEAGLKFYSDLNLNHMGGSDETEWTDAYQVNPENRFEAMGADLQIQAWSKFNFPGRQGKYSDFVWRWYHFDGTDRDENQKLSGIFQFRGENKHWDSDVDTEKGNFDYLLMNDLDLEHPEVRQELIHWGRWFTKTTSVDGFRIDAAKHTSFQFTLDWLQAMEKENQTSYFAVAEYWSYDLNVLHQYLQKTNEQISLFDFILQDHLAQASKQRGYFDLSRLFENTLTKAFPAFSVTFTDNHDTQRHAPSFGKTETWFKPLAYALILLRMGGYPCIFYPDYFDEPESNTTAIQPTLDLLLMARKTYSHGAQHDYFDDQDIVGWTREGNQAFPKAMAVVLSDSFRAAEDIGSKEMFVGRRPSVNARVFKDITGNFDETVLVSSEGIGRFPVKFASDEKLGRSLSIWVEQ
jgi:alpha-amylase